MKLHLVPARTGYQWFKQGVRAFLRQPIALSGLFFVFMALMSLLRLIPVLGNVLALALLPGATLGLMAATREASEGQFPLPTVLLSAFRAGRKQLRAILILGALYAGSFMLVLALSALIDGGRFAQFYLLGTALSPESMQDSHFDLALILAMALYMPLSLLFWHAPALVHWHGVAPVKSLFFSLVACLRNFWAFTVYSLVWLLAFLVVGVGVELVAVAAGSTDGLADILFSVMMLLAAVFFTSIYFTFRDCFNTGTGETS